MRLVPFCAAALLALPVLTSAALAQRMPARDPMKEEHPQFDERRYKAATESVPAAQQQSDPWAGAREPTSAATPATAAAPAPKNRKKQ